MLTRRSLMGSATALALFMGIAAPAFADPDAALAKLQETVLSKGPSGEDPSPASDVVLSDEDLAKIKEMGDAFGRQDPEGDHHADEGNHRHALRRQ